MSESSKRGDTGRLVDRLKLIQELKDMNFYEEGMAINEMQDIIKVVKESKDTAKPGSQNRITNEMPEHQQQVNQPCYSQITNANSSAQTQRRSTSPVLSTNQHNAYVSQGNGSDSQDEAIFSSRGRNPFDKNKDKESKEAPTNPNKARSAINENTVESPNENKRANTRANSQLRSEERIPKWKINPLDYMPNEKDKPLKTSVHGSSEREGVGARTLANINKDIARLSLHLQKVSDVCRSQRWGNAPSDNPWGTGIKVGTANGSLDRRAVADDTTVEAEEPPDEPNQNVVNEMMNGRRRRGCVERVGAGVYNEIDDNNSEDEFETRQKKRKPTKLENLMEESRNSKDTNLNVISENSKRRKFPVRDDEYHWGDNMMVSSDEEDAEKPTRRKKAKVSNTRKPTSASSRKAKSVELVSTDESKDNPVNEEAAEQICIEDSDEVTICEDAATSRSKTNRPKRSGSAEVTSSEYPRRIVPPLPGGKYAGIRARKPLHPNALRANKRDEQGDEDDAEVARTLSRSRGKVGLQDDEIAKQLENEEDIVEAPWVDTSKIVSLRPSSRLRMQCERLRGEQQKEVEAKLIHQEEQRLKDEEDNRRKMERVKQRLQEEAQKVKLEERNEKHRLAFEQTWREKMRAKEKQRQMERIELNPEGPRQGSDVPSVEVVPENHYEMEQRDVEVLSDNRRSNLSQPGEVPCPICNKNFPAGQIMAHAAGCEEYDATSSTGGSRSNSPVVPRSSGTRRQRDNFSTLLSCDTCSKFTAKNGRELEDHVTSCLARRRDGGNDGSGSIVAVPDSPIRTVKKNSEQTDSEINYADQLVPKTRSNSNASVKRKRR